MGAVTIATNMAGRGTDIQLGGNVEFRVEGELADMPEGPAAVRPHRTRQAGDCRGARAGAGGRWPFVLGTERHESRRIDNQLRGRSGRQGDPGLSRFYLSLDDDLLRIFGPDTLFARMMRSSLRMARRCRPPSGCPRPSRTAQRQGRAAQLDVRKQVVEYDDVMNDQRKVIYEQRADIMDAETVSETMTDMRHETINTIIGAACPHGTYPEQWDIPALKAQVEDTLALTPDIDGWLEEHSVEPDIFVERLIAMSDAALAEKVAPLKEESWAQIEKSILLQNLDHHWKEHLATLDALRQVVHLRAYAQKTPLNEYKQEAFALFERMLNSIREDVTRTISHLQFQMQDPAPPPLPELPSFLTSHIDPFTGEDNSADIDAGSRGFITTTIPRTAPALAAAAGSNPYADQDISRNAPCPCGSGEKYKHCHGAYS